jgi:transcriptional regulator with XRE-family HTH domain
VDGSGPMPLVLCAVVAIRRPGRQQDAGITLRINATHSASDAHSRPRDGLVCRTGCHDSLWLDLVRVGRAVPSGDGSLDVLLSKRRRLGTELRRLREQAGLSGRALAEQIGVSQSKVSRIEAGATIPAIPEVAGWTAAVNASEAATSRAMALADAAYTEVSPWDAAMRERSHLQGDIQEIEARARSVLVYEPTLVPGLLQTAEYARRVFSMFEPAYAGTDIAGVTAGRVNRQVALFDPARQFGFLITEAALRWRPGPPSLMLAQLDRIASVSTLGNVVVGVIRQSGRALTHVPHGFTVIEPADPEDDALVLVETVHAGLTVSDAGQVSLYRRQWSLLKQMAVHGQDARDLLSGIAASTRELPEEDGS